MSPRKTFAAVLLIVLWCTTALHVELEGADLLPEHTNLADHGHHQHRHAPSHAPEHPHGEPADPGHSHHLAAHDELVARHSGSGLSLLLALALVAAAALFLPAFFWLPGPARQPPVSAGIHPPDTPRPWAYPASAWRFLRRCAANSLAPPATA